MEKKYNCNRWYRSRNQFHQEIPNGNLAVNSLLSLKLTKV